MPHPPRIDVSCEGILPKREDGTWPNRFGPADRIVYVGPAFAKAERSALQNVTSPNAAER